LGGTSAWCPDAVAAGAVPGAAFDAAPGEVADAEVGAEAGAEVGAEAGAEVGAEAGAEVGAEAGAEVGAVAEADDADGSVAAVVADAGDVAAAPLADAVLEVDSMLATSTPTPSAAPLSSVTSGMLSFMASTPPRRIRVQSHPTIVRSCRGTRPDRRPRRARRTGGPRGGAEPS
jgi:hypothetical protein